MSTPIRSEDGIDDPLLYAPRWARQSPPVAHEPAGHAPTIVPANANAPATALRTGDAPPMAPGVGGPNLELPPPRLRPFEGDLAVKDLRHRLALDPELVPQPPLRLEHNSVVPWIGRLAFVLIAAATAGFAVTLITIPNEARKDVGGIAAVVAPLIDTASRVGSASPQARLVVESQRGFANEPIPLGISLADASGGESLTLVGLAAGTRLSAGMPLGITGWQLSARDIGKAFAHAPKDFVGVMDAAIDLRSPRDRIMDSQFVRLEWLPKKEARLPPRLDQAKLAPVIRRLDPAEITMLIKRGEDFLKNGDIASARLFLRRAANAGNGQAALALGVTFDPYFLSEQGVLGFAPDVAQARSWYERAAELGSSEALRRLERLAKLKR